MAIKDYIIKDYVEKNNLVFIKSAKCPYCNSNANIYRTKEKNPLIIKTRFSGSDKYSYKAICACGRCGSGIFDDNKPMNIIEFELLNRMYLKFTEDGKLKF